MRSFLILMISFMALVAGAQFFPPSPNRYDENGQRTGHWTILYDSTFSKEIKDPDSAHFYRLIRFEAGKPVGKVRNFTRTGRKQWEGYLLSLAPEVLDGEARYYFENGQVQHVVNFKNGKSNGPRKEYNVKGVLVAEGTMKNDSLEGPWIIYHDTGEKYKEITFKRSREEGEMREYYTNGVMQRRRFKVHGLDNGLVEEYYQNGNINTRYHTKNGVFHGTWEWFNDKGIRTERGIFENGKGVGDWIFYQDDGITLHSTGKKDSLGKQGQWTYYHPNGVKHSEGPFINNVANGIWSFYATTGQISEKGERVNGYYEGEWHFWYDNGALYQTSFWKLDTLHGYQTLFYPNGNKKFEVDFDHGKRNGLCQYYFNDGSLDGIETYSKGLLEGSVYNYYQNRILKDTATFRGGKYHGHYSAWHENGKLKSEGNYREGLRVGEWRWYYANGQLESKYQYVNGKMNGPFEDYHANGNKKRIGTQKDDKREGWIKYWFENGQLKMEGLCRNDRGEGKWIYYDSATGKKTQTRNYLNNELHGKSVFYLPSGKKESKNYYIRGFWEETYSIRDSIYKLIDANKFELATQATRWLERVIKRDGFADSKRAAIPASLYSTIALRQHNYASALRWSDEDIRLTQKYEGDTVPNYFNALNDRANIYVELKKMNEALRLFNSSIQFDSLNNRAKGYWVSVSNYAGTLLKNGDQEKGIEFIKSRLDSWINAKGANSTMALEGLYILARFYGVEVINYDDAIRHYKELYTAVEQGKHSDERSLELKKIAVEKIADYLNTKGAVKESIPWLKKTIDLKEQDKNSYFNQYHAYYQFLGIAYYKMVQRDSALLVFNRMLEIIGTNKEQLPLAYANAASGIADVWYAQGKRQEAYTLYMEVKQLLEDTENTKANSYYNVLNSLVDIYLYYDRVDEARKLTLLSVNILKEIHGENSIEYAQSLIALADFYRQNRENTKALETLEQAEVILASNKASDFTYAECLYFKGQVYDDLNEIQNALKSNQKAISLYERDIESTVGTYVNALRQQSRYYKRLENYDSAEFFLSKALPIVEKTYGTNSRRHLDFQGTLAYLRSSQMRHSEAEKILLNMLAGYRKITSDGDDAFIIALRDVAQFYYDQYRYQEATPYYTQIKDLLSKKKAENTYNFIDAVYRLAQINYSLGNNSLAEQYFIKAAELSREVYGDPHSDYAFQLQELGIFYRQTNRYREAEETLSKAVDNIHRFTRGKEPATLGRYQVELAIAKSRREKNKEAEDLFREALENLTYRKDDRWDWYVNGLRGFGSFLVKMGRLKDAETLYLEISTILEVKRGKKYNYYDYRMDLVSLYYDWNKSELAIQEAKEILAYTDSELATTHQLTISAHNMLGLIYYDQNNFTESEKHFQECIDAYKLLGREEATYENNIGLAFLAQGRLKEAENKFMKAMELRKKSGVVLDPETYIVVLDNIASLYQAQGRLAESEKVWLDVIGKALQFTNENFYFLSDEEKTQFWGNIKEDFEYFNTFAVMRSASNPAILGAMYDNQLATKAILLSASSKVKNRILGSNDTIMIAQYYNWIDAREKLAQLYSLTDAEQKIKKHEMDSIQFQLNTIEKELSITAQDVDREKEKSTSWRDVQKLLGPSEAAIEIIRYRYFDRYLRDSILYAALVLTSETKSNPRLVVLPYGEQLEGRNLRYYKNAIASKLDDKISYGAYWSPIESLVKNKTRIYLSLDGVYNQINLNTLLDEQGKYLVDSKNLTIVSNTKDLLALKSKKPQRKQANTASLFGYPRYFIGKDRIREKASNQNRQVDFSLLDERDATGINELPGTRTEVAQVKSILTSRQWDAVDFTDENASEKALKSIGYPNVLHIATHGFFVDENEASATFKLGTATEYARQNPLLRSGILLSGASNFIQNNFRLDNENGILTAYEASNLNLDNTDLVVLSACETGKGEVQNGEGVYGLQRAFQTAGAQAIIMSLWKVDDTATQELMTTFYQSWTNGSSKAEAFRKAQQEIKNKYNHPYYWGAFVMMGE